MHRTPSRQGSTPAIDLSRNVATRALLRCGAVAGPLYIVVGAIQLLVRPGFDMRVNALSQMSLGDLGWIQTADFALSGALVIAGAFGLRRAVRVGSGAAWGARLVAVYGAGLIAAAIFPADPGFGFPPGTPAGPPTTMSSHALLHFASAGIAFFALIAACFVFARRFASRRQSGRAALSRSTGAFFLVACLGTASGSGLTLFMLGLWAAIILAWVWLSVLLVTVDREWGDGRSR